MTGFALASAVGGAAQSFELLIAARWCMFINVAFGALALSGALSLMTNNGNPDKPRLTRASREITGAAWPGCCSLPSVAPGHRPGVAHRRISE